MEQYDIYMGDRPVGQAAVERQGLYYHIRCRCQLTGEILCKVVVSRGDRQESLGLLVPMAEEFGLETRLAVKKLGEGDLRFRVLPRHGELQGKFIPLSPEEPFRYLSKLKNAFLENRNGRVGVVIKSVSSE